MSGTRYAVLAFAGSLGRSNSRVPVVVIGTPLGVFRVMAGSCVSASFAIALFPRHETEAAESRKAVVKFLLGGLQPDGLMLQMLIVLSFNLNRTAGTRRHAFPALLAACRVR